jgi:hypothetical protein
MRCSGSTGVGSDSEPEENKRKHCCTWEFGSQKKLHREEARREEDAVEECRNRMNPDIIAAIPERALSFSLSLSLSFARAVCATPSLRRLPFYLCLLLDGWMNYSYMDETYGCVCGHCFLIYYYVKVGISVLNQQKRCNLSTHVSKENIMDIPY